MPSGLRWWSLIIVTVMVLVVVPSTSALSLASDRANQESSGMVSSVVHATTSPGLNLTVDSDSVIMGLGTDAIVGLTITGINGFNDSVGLSTSIAPNPPGTTADGFSASFNQAALRISPASPTAHLNVTIRAYTLPPYLPAYPPLGSYTMTVSATGQTPPLYVRSTQIQVTVQPYAPPQPKLLFELAYVGRAYPGSMIRLEGNFTDIGNVQASIAGLDFTGDFGTFNTTSGFPIPIAPAQKTTVSLTMIVPDGMSIGTHVISAMSTWQYYLPNHYDSTRNIFYPGGWYTGNAINVTGSITVVAKSSSIPLTPLAPILSIISQIAGSPFAIVGLAFYLGLATLASVLMIRNDHRKIRELSKNPHN